MSYRPNYGKKSSFVGDIWIEIRMQGASSETTTGEEKKVRSFTARRHIRKSELNEDQKNELNLVGVADLENASGIIRYNTEQMLALRGNAEKQIDLVEADCVISPEEYAEMMEEHEELIEEKEHVSEVPTEFPLEVANTHRRDKRIRNLRNIMNQFTLDNPELIIEMLYSNLQEYINEPSILKEAIESILNKCCTDTLYCDGFVAALRIISERMTSKELEQFRFTLIEYLQEVYETPAPEFSNESKESEILYEHNREGYFHFLGALFTNGLICEDIVLRVLVDLSQFYPSQPTQIRYLLQVVRTIGSFMERDMSNKLTIDEIFRSLHLWQEEKILPESMITEIRGLRDLKDAKWVVTIEADKTMESTVSSEWEKSIAGRRNKNKKEVTEEQAEATRVMNELILYCKNMWYDYVQYFVVDDICDEVQKFDDEQQAVFIHCSLKALVNHTEMEQRRVSLLLLDLVNKEIMPHEVLMQGFEQILSDYSKVHKTNKHALTAFRNMYFPLLMNKMISIHDIVDCWKNKEHFDFALVELVFDLMNTWKNIEKEEAMKAMKEAALTMDLLFVGGCPSMVAKRILSKFNMIEKESVIDFA